MTEDPSCPKSQGPISTPLSNLHVWVLIPFPRLVDAVSLAPTMSPAPPPTPGSGLDLPSPRKPSLTTHQLLPPSELLLRPEDAFPSTQDCLSPWAGAPLCTVVRLPASPVPQEQVPPYLPTWPWTRLGGSGRPAQQEWKCPRGWGARKPPGKSQGGGARDPEPGLEMGGVSCPCIPLRHLLGICKPPALSWEHKQGHQALPCHTSHFNLGRRTAESTMLEEMEAGEARLPKGCC